MLKDKYLPIISQEVAKIRKTYKLSANAPIGDYIFDILQKECILAEWPEDKQLDLDGLSTEKVIHGRLETIVYINSAKNKEKQNFCAAHELGHRHKLDIQLKDSFPDDIINHSTIEDVMNRFAAELMMPEGDFKRRSSSLYKACQGKQNGRKVVFIKKLLESIAALMDFYYVPYKAVVLRLQETKVVAGRIIDELLKFEKSDAGRNIIDEIIRKRGITRLRTPDRKTQYSVQLGDLHSILKDTSITKYMTRNELRKYLKTMGFAEEDLKLIEDMKKIEEETIEMDETKEPEEPESPES